MDFQDLFSNIPESLVVVSPEYKIMAASKRYLQTTMRKLEDLIGLHFLKEAFPEKDIAYEDNPIKHALDKASETLKPVRVELRYDIEKPKAEGGGYDTRYWETIHTPVTDEKGKLKYLIQTAHDITEQIIIKQTQAETEVKFKFLTDAVPELIHMADTNGNVTYMNERWLTYTGLPFEKLSGTQWHQVIHPHDLEAIQERFKEFLPDKEFQVEVRLRNAEGNYRWFLSRSKPVLNADGNTVLRIGASTDIHQSKLMVEELLHTNEQMSELADQVKMAYEKAEAERVNLERVLMQAPVIIAILEGPNHVFTLINEHYQRLFPNRKLLGLPLAEAVPEIKDQGFIEMMDKIYTTGEPYVFKEILAKLDRNNTGVLEDVYFTTTYQPLFNGKAIHGIIACGLEVTEQVQLRNQLQTKA